MQRFIDGQLITVHKDAFDIADGIVNNASYDMPAKFYCGKDKSKQCCLTHLVGLPVHPATRRPMSLTPYQIDLQKLVHSSKPQKYIINKSRQLGFTEIILRIIQHEALTGKYQGGKIGIMAGTNADLARKNLRRLYELFKLIPYMIKDTYFRGHLLHLSNGVIIEAFRANEESITGDTNYRAIFLDESAKWRLRDDSPVFNSILPIVETNKADLFLVSTPKGPIKKFHEIWTDQDSDFVKLEYPIHVAKDSLYSEQDIKTILNNSVEDINQEYLCKFTIGRGSVFGEYSNVGNHEEILI